MLVGLQGGVLGQNLLKKGLVGTGTMPSVASLEQVVAVAGARELVDMPGDSMEQYFLKKDSVDRMTSFEKVAEVVDNCSALLEERIHWFEIGELELSHQPDSLRLADLG